MKLIITVFSLLIGCQMLYGTPVGEIIQGDILVPKVKIQQKKFQLILKLKTQSLIFLQGMSGRAFGLSGRTYIWPNGVIPYIIDPYSGYCEYFICNFFKIQEFFHKINSILKTNLLC